MDHLQHPHQRETKRENSIVLKALSISTNPKNKKIGLTSASLFHGKNETWKAIPPLDHN